MVALTARAETLNPSTLQPAPSTRTRFSRTPMRRDHPSSAGVCRCRNGPWVLRLLGRRSPGEAGRRPNDGHAHVRPDAHRKPVLDHLLAQCLHHRQRLPRGWRRHGRLPIRRTRSEVAGQRVTVRGCRIRWPDALGCDEAHDLTRQAGSIAIRLAEVSSGTITWCCIRRKRTFEGNRTRAAIFATVSCGSNSAVQNLSGTSAFPS
jgi:hypothetical protein